MITNSSGQAYDPLYVAFLYHFNRTRDYYECHEVMEELWLEEGRDRFYQGLLQVAVALYHHRNDNFVGGVKLLKAAIEKLTIHSDGKGAGVHGLDLESLLRDAREHLCRLERCVHEGEAFAFRDITIRIADSALAKLVAHYSPEIGSD